MESVFAGCPHDDCVECSFRCVSKDVAMVACGAAVDLMGQELGACEFCKRQNEIASQDYDEYLMNEILGGVEESKDGMEFTDSQIFGEESVEEKVEVLNNLEKWMERMDAEAAKYTTLTPQKRERVDGVEYTMFKPFDYSKRIRPSERDDFKEFLKLIF